MRRKTARVLLVLGVALAVLAVPATALADPVPPIFGLGTDGDGDVVVASNSVGVTEVDGTVIAGLPNVNDVAASDQGWLWAITGGGPGPGDAMLYKVHPDGTVEPFADLGAYEEKYNPHPANVDSNPYSVIDFGRGEAVVADAAGNTLLKVNKHGKVKLIAVFPDEVVSTANARALVEEAFGPCDSLPPDAPELAQFACGPFEEFPAESVPTSVTLGPDGYLYVGELKGFPAPVGESKLWKIRATARNADCARSPLCSVVDDGFTSIVDLTSDDEAVYVAELEEKSRLAFELAFFFDAPVAVDGGTITACNGSCGPISGPIPLLSALTVDGQGDLWYTSLLGPPMPF
jgi:hypothetical protein